MKQLPMIQKVMTPMPFTVSANASLKDALNLMRDKTIRHLPVLKNEKLVGVVTDRDIKLTSSFSGAQSFTVEDIMTPHPYSVTPETPLDHVVSQMAESKYGCAIITQENGKIVGIFTAVDALRVLSDTLQLFYRPQPDSPLARRT